jgi:sigma-B regulation protein RsbU (phosphoserine phosphatase)
VGGDYYDFFWIDDTHLGFVVADVSGKGVHAALIAAMIRSIFRTQARGNTDVRSSLAQANGFIGEDLRSDMFVTCIYGILDTGKSTFEWGRAGHEPLVVAHASGETDVLSPNGFALGVVPSPDFDELLEVETIHLKSGDRILIFTDGLTEAMNAKEEEFGMQRILDIMQNPGQEGEDNIQMMEREVAEHVGGAAQSDDLTIVYLGVK